jgi:hypothetical protein
LKLDAVVAVLVLLVRLRVLVLGLEVLLRLLEARLLVDVDFFAVLLLLGTTEALFLMDADLFLDVGVAVVGRVNGGGEGFVCLFVTFPSL